MGDHPPSQGKPCAPDLTSSCSFLLWWGLGGRSFWPGKTEHHDDLLLLDSCGEYLYCSGPGLRGLAEASLMHTRMRAWRPGVGILSYMLHSVLGLQSKAFFVPSAQRPPRGPRPSVSAGGKTCWSTMVARPGTTSMCPSATIWATSSPCSAMGRVTSAGVWTKTAERWRAPAPRQASPLHVSTQGRLSLASAASEVSLQGGCA